MSTNVTTPNSGTYERLPALLTPAVQLHMRSLYQLFEDAGVPEDFVETLHSISYRIKKV